MAGVVDRRRDGVARCVVEGEVIVVVVVVEGVGVEVRVVVV